MKDRDAGSGRLVALSLLGAALLGYPLISIANVPALVFGVPVLYAYLFGVWALLVALIAVVVES